MQDEMFKKDPQPIKKKRTKKPKYDPNKKYQVTAKFKVAGNNMEEFCERISKVSKYYWIDGEINE